MCLVFSVEATGRPQPDLVVSHPDQPHLVNFAAILFDSAGAEVERLATLVKPRSDAELPLRSYQDLGPTLELAIHGGSEPTSVFRWFIEQADRAKLIVGHDLPYCIDMMKILSAQITGQVWFLSSPTYCTMAHSAPWVEEPRTRDRAIAGNYVSGRPSLSRCMDHFFEEPLSSSIDELSAVRACHRLYRHLASNT